MPIASVVLMSLISGAPLDASVSTTRGGEVRLKTLWGKPCVLFYEDREGASLNQGLKKALFTKGKQERKLDAVKVVAVANLKAFAWYPARTFAEAAIASAEQKAGIPLYADWTGALLVAPWNLPASGSTVVVLDARGGEVWRGTGDLSEADQAKVLSAIESLLASAALP